MRKTISNGILAISADTHGAELCSLECAGTEYLWQADPAFWKRHSPVLFPIVGAVYGNTYRAEGKEYSLSQHGFARDMEFRLLQEGEDCLWFRLESSDETLARYPYAFVLDIGYRIDGHRLHVMWKVHNPSDRTIHFQIGAHPAFYLRDGGHGAARGYFSFGDRTGLQYILIGGKGCADPDTHYALETDGQSMLPVVADTFSRDALIFEDSQLTEVTLHDSGRTPYLRMEFTAPVTGLWAPAPDSPFVCIEPWYGRCDRVGYTGDFADRDWMRHLGAGETFTAGYTIEVLQTEK